MENRDFGAEHRTGTVVMVTTTMTMTTSAEVAHSQHTPESYSSIFDAQNTFRIIRPHTDGCVSCATVWLALSVFLSICVGSTQFMLLAYEQSQAFYLAVDVNQLFLFEICWWCCCCVAAAFFCHCHYHSFGRIFWVWCMTFSLIFIVLQMPCMPGLVFFLCSLFVDFHRAMLALFLKFCRF